MKNLTRALFLVLLIAEAIGWTGAYPWNPVFSWVGLILTSLAVWGVLEWLDLPGALWPLIFAGALLDTISDVFHLYSRFASWDRGMHLMGGALLGLGALACVNRSFGARISSRWRIVVVIGIVALFGTLYELSEWGVDQYYFGHSRALGSAADTVDDEVLNIVGGFLIVGTAELLRRKR